ncbi:putative sensory transduction protein [Aeromonas diversa CDC 2478-85]|uniref:Putative sensory transduction protein n=1 Tax=Aeromonas diversa CDC 2478-85 TaxID=1268237 RepID=N9U1B7_9GAMM|nr:response regulator [Aeromonas diversa]ENY72164.1 putative sensory transduction protein [Aeromonas diversa CDC 2478-85]
MTEQEDESDLLFVDDEPTSEEKGVARPRLPWAVLIVDDEPDIHAATRLAVRDIRYKERGLELLSAHNGGEAIAILKARPDIALVLLDVVMESDDAGLKVARRIREELGNHLVRIVLRTGQPGQAPEKQVVLDYDINDYKTKTELTAQKLFTSVIASLRSYESLHALECSRQGLSKILDGAGDLYRLRSLKEFASGVLRQVSALLDVGAEGILCAERTRHDGELQILATTGIYDPLLEGAELARFPNLIKALDAAIDGSNYLEQSGEAIFLRAQNGREFVLCLTPAWPLEPIEQDLFGIFCQRISAAYDNLYLNRQLLSAQEATVVALAALAEFRDSDTGEHVLRVQKLSEAIAMELATSSTYGDELTPRFREMIGMASILHDVGKVGTPDSILHKPARFDPEERRIMEQHASIGANILADAGRMVEGMSYLSLGAEIARYHHEHFDGNGYPEHLKGEQIPLSARIVAVVDVFDALLSKRPYKEPWPLERVLTYLEQGSGSQFDPQVVAAMLKLVREQRLPIPLSVYQGENP